jgi:competence ComEA-like helix-hairpin-helix protein
MIKINSVNAEAIRRLPTAMSPEHLVLALALLLAGYALCGWPEGSPETGGIRRSPHAWGGSPQSKKARVLRMEGDIARPGIYVLAPGESIGEVLREAGVRGAIPRSLPEGIPSGTVIVLRSWNGEAQVAGIRGIPPVEKLVLGLPLDINTAEAETLAHVPGIGPFRAERIIAERDRRGGFKDLLELESVPGIGSGIRRNVERYLEVVQTSSSNPERK